MPRRISSLVTLLDAAEIWLAGLTLGVASLLVFISVILRYCFHYSVSAFEEIIRYLIIWSTFLGGSALLRRNGHITIDILIVRLKERQRLILQTFAYILGIVFCALLTIKGFGLVEQSIRVGAKSMSTLRLPMYIPQLAVPVGGLLMMFRFGQKVYENLTFLSGAKESRG
ncbi:MAG: TRAP transporter small permease [Armatimonadetes bacterium]|nr:TRAP transporter small permease [Armatimonadota bacterium]